MKRPLIALTLLVLLGTAPALVFARTDTYTYNGRSLFATFTSRQDKNRTVTTVIASMNKTGGPGQNNRPMIMVQSSTFDRNRGRLRWNSFGVTNSFRNLNINNQLRRGRVRANVQAYDSVKNRNVGVRIDLRWNDAKRKRNGVNRTYRVRPVANENRAPAAIRLNGRIQGSERLSDVTGTVRRGQRNWAAGRVLEADIQNLTSGSVTVQRPDQ